MRPAGAAQAAASTLPARLAPVVAEASRKLPARRFANVNDRRRAVYAEVHGMLDENVCTEDEYYGEAEAVVGALVCELIPARGNVRERRRSSRTSRRSGRGKPTRTAQCAHSAKTEDPPSGDVSPVGEDGPSPPARHLDVEALVAAAVERAVAPVLDENRCLRARLDALEAAAVATREPGGRVLRARAHSADFASVRWDGQTFVFTPLQAAVVAVLWKAWEAGTPSLRAESIGERAGSAADRFRLDLLFRDHPALGTLIVRAGKGLWSIGDVRGAAGAVPQKHRCGTVGAPRGVEGRRA